MISVFLICICFATTYALLPVTDLVTVVSALRMAKVALFCPMWSLTKYKEFASTVETSFLFNSDLVTSKSDANFDSILICLDGTSEEQIKTIFDLNSPTGRMSDKLVLYRDDEDLKKFSSVTIPLNIRVWFLNEDTLKLSDIYDVDGERYEHTLGSIDPNGFEKKLKGFKARNNFRGKHLRIITEMQVPFQYPKPGFEGDPKPESPEFVPITGKWQGMFMETLDILSRELNFTFSLYRPKDMVWGGLESEEANGTKTYYGMIETLRQGKMDLLAGSMTLTRERVEAVDFVAPLATQTEAVFIKNTGVKELSWDLFYSPLNLDSWLMMVLFGAAMALTVRAIKIYQLRSLQRPKKLSALGEVAYFLRCFGRTCGTYFGGKDLSRDTDESALRFLVWCIILFGNIIFLAYQASLTSGLSVIKTVKPFSNLEEMLASAYRMKITGNTNQALLFQQAVPGTLFDQIFNSKMKPYDDDAYVTNIREGMEDLLQSSEKLAFFDDLEGMNSFSEARDCKVVAAWYNANPKYMSMAFPKASPYYRIFNDVIVSLHEAGVIDLLKSQWQPDNPSCFRTGGEAVAIAIGLDKMVSLFAMLGMAMGVATSILGVEFMWTRSLRKSEAMEKRRSETMMDPGFKEFYLKKCEIVFKRTRSEGEVAKNLRKLADEMEGRHNDGDS